jgi:hypothetical protein
VRELKTNRFAVAGLGGRFRNGVFKSHDRVTIGGAISFLNGSFRRMAVP